MPRQLLFKIYAEIAFNSAVKNYEDILTTKYPSKPDKTQTTIPTVEDGLRLLYYLKANSTDLKKPMEVLTKFRKMEPDNNRNRKKASKQATKKKNKDTTKKIESTCPIKQTKNEVFPPQNLNISNNENAQTQNVD